MPTIAEVQQTVLFEVGAGLEGLPDTVLADVLDKVTPYVMLYWDQWAWKGLVYPGLQVLYVKRQCLDVLSGQVRDLMPVTVGAGTINQDRIFTNLQALRKNVQDEIQRVEQIASQSRPVALGTSRVPPITQDFWGNIYRTDVPPYGQRPAPVPPDMLGRGW